MNNIRLIALDMDGTTLNNDHLTVCPRNLSAINAAIAKGVLVVTATGRMRYRLPEPIEAIREMRYAVTSNGAAVYDLWDDALLYENPLSTESALRAIDLLTPIGVYLELYYHGKCYSAKAEDAVWHSFPFTEGRRQMMTRNRFLVENLRAFVADDAKRIEKINMPYIPPEIHETAWARLRSLSDLVLTSSIPENAELNTLHADKADGLAQLCRHLGIQPEEVLAVGDNDNDRQMLRFAGYSAVPCNGLEECRAIATLVTTDNENGAVAEAIEHFVL